MKYPRTYHLPWSPGGTKDDKKLKSVDSFLTSPGEHKVLILTEKLDGSNTCLKQEGVFARSHNQVADHKSFDYIKGKWSQLKYSLKEGEEIFGENCFAVHSLEYTALSDYFYVFNIRYQGKWLSFQDVESRAQELGLQMVPKVFEGIVVTEKRLQSLTEMFMRQPSFFGGEREGVVLRLAQEFYDKDFSSSVAKMVRKDHVQTDEHWMHQEIRKQKLKKG